MSYFGINVGKNEEQEELARLIMSDDIKIIFCDGPAGTGKTFVSIACALELKEQRKFSSICYCRDAVSVGKDLGYLPGTVDEKYGPYLGPLTDNVRNIVRVKLKSPNGKLFGSNSKQKNQQIEADIKDILDMIETPTISYLRGRSFEDTVIIVDEAQNLDLTALKTVLTRVGEHCKIILLGSGNQIDNWRQRAQSECDFNKVMRKLSQFDYVSQITLTKSMRARWTVEVDSALSSIPSEEHFEHHKDN